jgi:integrase/recombinase XerD
VPSASVTPRDALMHLRQRQRRTKEDESPYLAAPRLEVFGMVGKPLPTSLEFDYPERFVQDQVGHAYASTTAIYTGVSDAYRNRLLQRSLQRHEMLWEKSE